MQHIDSLSSSPKEPMDYKISSNFKKSNSNHSVANYSNNSNTKYKNLGAIVGIAKRSRSIQYTENPSN